MPSTKKSYSLPTANLDALFARQTLNQQIRDYFKQQNILEVETPLLSQAPNCDRGSHSFKLDKRYLHSSPEHAMKRLLCSGSGSIYQLCKVFRADEAGSKHNPEFTMLEWYRIDFSYHELMAEVARLANLLLQTNYPTEYITYAEAFKKYAGFDPFLTNKKDIQETANEIAQQPLNLDMDSSLDLIMSHRIEPKLNKERLVFLTDFPASQAAMAKLKQEDGLQLAMRFELFINNMEIANGYEELSCPKEQEARFISSHGIADERLLDCMKHHPLPACSGVAMGIDRLLMLKLNKTQIQEVLSFAWEQA